MNSIITKLAVSNDVGIDSALIKCHTKNMLVSERTIEACVHALMHEPAN